MTPFGAAIQPSGPPPPPGPGVAPPFAAPPTDRDPKTVWIRVGVSALLLLLCCVGGIGGLGVVLAGTSKQLEAQARTVVGEYLGDLRDDDYSSAYDLLCQSTTDSLTKEAFTVRERRRQVTDYTVDSVQSDSQLVVTATVITEQGSNERKYVVSLDGGQLQICGES
jgi:hypothetical protein